jgi:acylaminoacyl-peptidase
MCERTLPVTYIVYPDEGHGFMRPESRTSFNAISEAFFAMHLSGRCEPFGSDLLGSSLQVREGIEHIAGLRECLGP